MISRVRNRPLAGSRRCFRQAIEPFEHMPDAVQRAEPEVAAKRLGEEVCEAISGHHRRDRTSDRVSDIPREGGRAKRRASDARNHERPNHLRLFQEGREPRSFRDRNEDAEHIAHVRDLERRNKQATQEFLPRWNEAEKATRAGRK